MHRTALPRAAWHGLWIVPTTALLGFGLAMVYQIDPSQPGSPFPGCFFHQVTGWHCPGCGSTRAVHALLHFDVARALHMNALLLFTVPFMPGLILRQFRPLPGWYEAIVKPVANVWFWLVLYLSFGILRNLPWRPFTYLAPLVG